MMVQATSSVDVINVAAALKTAVDGGFFAREYAKSIFTEYLKRSGYDVERKPVPKVPEKKIASVAK